MPHLSAQSSRYSSLTPSTNKPEGEQQGAAYVYKHKHGWAISGMPSTWTGQLGCEWLRIRINDGSPVISQSMAKKAHSCSFCSTMGSMAWKLSRVMSTQSAAVADVAAEAMCLDEGRIGRMGCEEM